MTTTRSTARPDAAAIKAVLRSRFTPELLQVRDDSHLHAGHAGASAGGHFHVRIRAASFAGLSRIARHRLVYDALAELIVQGIHALTIEADGPAAPTSL